MPSGQGGKLSSSVRQFLLSTTDQSFLSAAGTNPIHNKKPKKKQTEEDDDDKAHKAKLAADKKAREEMAKVAGKKGPMNAGQQGIKKSGKK
jgi:hypothetical protein